MLQAARAGDWDEVVKLEGACVLLMLKDAAREEQLVPNAAKLKARLMQRILVNDAEIRHLAEPWLEDLDRLLHRSLAAPAGSASGFTPGSTASCRREARHRPGAVTRGNPGALRRPVLGGGRYGGSADSGAMHHNCKTAPWERRWPPCTFPIEAQSSRLFRRSWLGSSRDTISISTTRFRLASTGVVISWTSCARVKCSSASYRKALGVGLPERRIRQCAFLVGVPRRQVDHPGAD